MKSIWNYNIELPKRTALQGNTTTEVAVVGAGLAGILTAYFLTRYGKQVIILEADRMASGQTQNTTAKLTIQHGCIYSDLIKSLGCDKAQLYAQANEQALLFYHKLIESQNINCHLKSNSSYIYSVKDKHTLAQEREAYRKIGLAGDLVKDTELPFPTVGALRISNQAQFHPLELIKVLAQDLTICEKTKVLSANGHELITDRGTVTADQIVFACHFPFVNIPGFYFARMYQERSYVLALSDTKKYNGMYYGIDKNGFSLRQAGDILLLGGGKHRCGQHPKSSSYQMLRDAAARYWPDAKEVCHWSAEDCMTPDRVPYIGSFSSMEPDWYIATGFQKWGMTTSMVAARLISDKILGRHNPYESVFSPQRLTLKASFKKECSHAAESAKALSQGFLPKAVRCTHMGCRLNWNRDESSWDCPCHGSRFDNNGKMINGPAQEDISFID